MKKEYLQFFADFREKVGFLYEPWLKFHYEKGFSAQELSDMIVQLTGRTISARSIQRYLQRHGVQLRSKSEAFKNAISRGRINYAGRTYTCHKCKMLI